MTIDRATQLAEERTRAAERRTLLSEERTFSAWIRTGLASAATGFAVAKLFTMGEESLFARLLGGAFVVAGAAMIGLGYLDYKRALKELEQPVRRRAPLWFSGVLTAVLIAASAAGLVLIFLE